jgi:transposase InsO family protein
VVQQLREAFPFDDAGSRSKYLVHDRDTIFSIAVVAAIESMGLESTRTSFQSPWQNGAAERFVGTIRRDLLDHAIVLDDDHLRRLLSEYLAYYHRDRTHLGLEKDAPVVRPVELRPAGAAAVHAQRRVRGLHHRDVWSAAA